MVRLIHVPSTRTRMLTAGAFDSRPTLKGWERGTRIDSRPGREWDANGTRMNGERSGRAVNALAKSRNVTGQRPGVDLAPRDQRASHQRTHAARDGRRLVGGFAIHGEIAANDGISADLRPIGDSFEPAPRLRSYVHSRTCGGAA